MIKEILIKIGHIILTGDIKLYRNNMGDDIDDENNDKIYKNHYLIVVLLFVNIILAVIIPYIILPLIIIEVSVLFIKYKLPDARKNKRKSMILKQLPFMLRQLATQLKAGIGLFDAMAMIADGNYGILSDEFKITLKQIQYGTNYIQALDELSKRVDIEIFTKIINQITRTLKNGGNLADILNTMANENSENMKIKYKQYSQKLNSVMLIYMFISVLIPTITFIMIITASMIMGPIIPPELFILLYLVFFPLIVVLMVIFIKSMEPTI